MNNASTRREFIMTGAALATATLTGCGVSRDGHLPAPKPELIDTHTHFYDPTRPQGVPWPPKDESLLYRTVLPAEYRALPVPSPVTGTVVVEASPWLEDNQWILDLARKEPFIQGLVGNLPIGSDAFAANLTRFRSDPRFRGIRTNARHDLASSAPAVRDLKLLADADLSLDLLGGMEILSFAQRLSARLPSLRIVIDHLAGLRIDGKAPPEDWSAAMKALSSARNVYFKVSGLVEGTGHSKGDAPADASFYAPVLDRMMELFGPDRLIYGSNWPVSARFAPLATVQGIVQDYFAGHPHAARRAVFSASAKAAYRI